MERKENNQNLSNKPSLLLIIMKIYEMLSQLSVHRLLLALLWVYISFYTKLNNTALDSLLWCWRIILRTLQLLCCCVCMLLFYVCLFVFCVRGGGPQKRYKLHDATQFRYIANTFPIVMYTYNCKTSFWK